MNMKKTAFYLVVGLLSMNGALATNELVIHNETPDPVLCIGSNSKGTYYCLIRKYETVTLNPSNRPQKLTLINNKQIKSINIDPRYMYSTMPDGRRVLGIFAITSNDIISNTGILDEGFIYSKNSPFILTHLNRLLPTVTFTKQPL